MKKIKVLDHGYVLLVDTFGTDQDIVSAARVSYQIGAPAKPNDETLLRYLLRCGHTSPFEQVSLKFEIKLPIFVERQWARHRTASWNELSARYSTLPNEFYVPEQVRAQSNNNKQGSDGLVSVSYGMTFKSLLEDTCKNAYWLYKETLDSGVSRELARMILPVNFYTAKVWTMDLHNLMHFLRLRLDEHAQLEIRLYAQAIADIVKEKFPWTWKAFEDYRLGGMYLTRQEIEATGTYAKGLDADSAARYSGITNSREAKECVRKVKRLVGRGD